MSADARRRVAVIAGAGPAGLTAAWELLARTDVLPVVIEPTPATGGIAQTFTYKGNRIDIGGHRFFSKSQRVMDWWFGILPRQGAPAADDAVEGADASGGAQAAAPTERFLAAAETLAVRAVEGTVTPEQLSRALRSDLRPEAASAFALQCDGARARWWRAAGDERESSGWPDADAFVEMVRS